MIIMNTVWRPLAGLGLSLWLGGVFSLNGQTVSANQVGYTPGLPKYVFVTSAADSFRIHDAATQTILYRGALTLWRTNDPSTGRTVRRGDFSTFQQEGSFRIMTSSGDSSAPLSISDTVYRPVFRATLKAFYFQRCGTALLAQHAGVYQHVPCHLNDGVFHSTADSAGNFPATGGWHDAGDYGKYVVNAGVTVGTLLMGYEYFPAGFGEDNLNIPESGNGVPDLLDEARYELEWLLKMQHSNGGVFCKLTREQFEGFVMPYNDTGTRYLYQVASTATGDFAAMTARAARIYRSFDTSFARRCESASLRAWAYLAAHPSIVPAGGFHNPSGTVTGEYGDGTDGDERLWAAAELFVTTGNAECHAYYQSHYSSGHVFGAAMSWPDVRSMAQLTYLKSQRPETNEGIRNQLRSALNMYCENQVTRRDGSGYHVVLQPGEYWWGSNAGALNAAVLLLMGYRELGTTAFREAAADQLHYVLGANAHGRSFVTGAGTRYPRQPHHRPSASDGVGEPVPGLLAGGPDQNRSDEVLRALFTTSTPPALCYVDSLPSYASNEIAINWNAPLVFVLGHLNGSGATSGGEPQGMVVPVRINLDQNYPNPFNGATVLPYSLSAHSRVTIGVYDLLGREVALLVNDDQDPGRYAVRFDGAGLASGIYLYRLQAGFHGESRRMLLLR
jgi:endoglucanase